jgi:hypothetical protein
LISFAVNENELFVWVKSVRRSERRAVRELEFFISRNVETGTFNSLVAALKMEKSQVLDYLRENVEVFVTD